MPIGIHIDEVVSIAGCRSSKLENIWPLRWQEGPLNHFGDTGNSVLVDLISQQS
ncbi:hypothetical protein [Belnapia sp. F-4-1]|uniref:hypothetical protein n=1 Tax=Belnapia sp. F-4-1 TaxID=1545443 RepID=UPI0013648F2E|nr:hypothetical protein [Belnapia sp. F-4-1]